MLSLQPWLWSLLIIVLYVAACAWWLWPRKLPALTHPSKMLVAFASVSGHSETLAKQLQVPLNAALVNLNQLNLELLQQAQTLLVIASTHGEGDAPENGRFFLSRCQSWPENSLQHLQCAVLALGDSSYPDFCAFGVQVAQALESRGAKPLFAPILVDDLAPDALQLWQQQLQQHLQDYLEPQELFSATRAAAFKAPAPQPLVLQRRQLINAGSFGRPMYELEFSAQGLAWQAGDIAKLHLGKQMREYSIASLPSENTLRLLVRWQEQGLGSSFLTQQLALGQSADFTLRANPSFHALDDAAPMILIGNGTGLAGLRAHLKQRELQQQHKNWLIYGERNPKHDRPWQAELDEWQRAGHLQHLDLAFSRADPCPNNSYTAGYVQQVLLAQTERLKIWLDEGAYIYLCGSKAGMASDVEQRLIDILGAQQYQELLQQERIKRDVY